MMTGAKSQRQLAKHVGVSHQRIGRWLSIGRPDNDGNFSKVKPPVDAEILRAIDNAFAGFTNYAGKQAALDKIPFNLKIPALATRMPFDDGKPGGRVLIKHTAFLSDALRHRVIAHAVTSKKYVGINLRSTVKLRDYLHRRDPTPWRIGQKAEIHGAKLKAELKSGVDLKSVFTPTSFTAFTHASVNRELDYRLRQRHEPAVGGSGTALADQILMQLDIAKDKTMKHSFEQRAKERAKQHSVKEKKNRDENKARRQNAKKPRGRNKG